MKAKKVARQSLGVVCGGHPWRAFSQRACHHQPSASAGAAASSAQGWATRPASASSTASAPMPSAKHPMNELIRLHNIKAL